MKLQHISLRMAGLGLLAVLACPLSAFAQYAWLDETGVKQFSDRPPPPNVPASRILKQPGGVPRPVSDEEQPSSEKAAPTLAERNAEFKKRQAEREDREKKGNESTQHSQDTERNCHRARDYQRSLDSGERIARLDGSGNRVYLNDEQRATEMRDNRRILDKCK
jgi:hypothetical protein